MYRVLLVEDDTALRFIYKKMKTWSECGFEISAEASNGKYALDILENETFDLIFTDIRMPFVDGIEMLRRLKDKENKIPVIFASSYDEFEYARQGLVLGAFDYLLKPVNAKKLEEVLYRARDRIEELNNGEQVEPAIAAVMNTLNISTDKDLFVTQVITYCSKHFDSIIFADEVAEELGYSKDYFGKLFKQHFDITFHDFYLKIKIEHAKELIRTGNYKTYEISEILCFSSVDYFTKVFKNVTGMTPSEYKSKLISPRS